MHGDKPGGVAPHLRCAPPLRSNGSTLRASRVISFFSAYSPFKGQFQLHFRPISLFQRSIHFYIILNGFAALDCLVKPASNMLVRPKLSKINPKMHISRLNFVELERALALLKISRDLPSYTRLTPT